HNSQRNDVFRDPLREACGGWALAQCGAKRSTEALAKPAARRPCGHEHKRNAHKDTPKKVKLFF
ncbi:MAG: hypothetical protein RML94_13845, partial [Bacteroidia bacterium]|nr:hypothetical protein [Bacteroidia bacterium]